MTQIDSEILVGVGNLSDIDFDALIELNSFGERDIQEDKHIKVCSLCSEGEYCEEYELLFEMEESVRIFSDGQIIYDGELKLDEDTISIKVNFNSFTYQVLKSPKIEDHGLCSPCYPSQADLDAKGNFKTYALPNDFKRK